jgi:hypothetical protein
MKICKILNESNKSIVAVVQVDKGEKADIEEMARLIDGDISHFGFSANIIKVGLPELTYKEEYHFDKPT